MCVRVRTMRSKGFETHVKERDWALFVGHLISRHQSANRQHPQISLCRICACLISPWVPAFACTHRVLRPARRAFVLLGGGSKMFGDIRCGNSHGPLRARVELELCCCCPAGVIGRTQRISWSSSALLSFGNLVVGGWLVEVQAIHGSYSWSSWLIAG